MDFDLNQHQQEVLARARHVAQTSIRPRAAEVDREGRFPKENLRDLHAAGLLQYAVPRDLGGLGAGYGGDYLLFGLVNEEIAKVCGSTAQALMVQGAATGTINLLGSELQRRRFAEEIVQDGRLFAYLGSEPNQRLTAKAAQTGYATVARRVGDGYVVSGVKRFATNSVGADYLMVLVGAEGLPFDQGLMVVVIPARDPGVTIQDTWPEIAMGQRGTGSGSVVFQECFVPDERVIGGPGEFFRPGVLGAAFQFGFVSVYLGMAEGAYEFAVDYLKTRARPPVGLNAAGEDPHVQYHVANMSIAIEATRWLTYRAAALLAAAEWNPEAFPEAAVAVYRAKVFATDTVLEVTNRVFQVCGASSTSREFGADRFWRDARTLTLHDPVDKRRVIVAEYELGLSVPERNTR